MAKAIVKRPYEVVSLDPFSIGKIRLSRGNFNNVKRNLLLAVCCLTSGHVQIEPIFNLSHSSISGAVFRISERYSTQTLVVYADNAPALGQEALAPEIQDYHDLRIGIDKMTENGNVVCINNPSYAEQRNFVERKINDVRKSIKQLTIVKKRPFFESGGKYKFNCMYTR